MERLAPGLKPVDLDAISTVRPHAEVVDALCSWLRSNHGHPASAHAFGARAREDLESARAEVAALVGTKADAVVFTSGAAEANNHAVKGAATYLRRNGRSRASVPAHERASLLHPARTAFGAELHLVPVGPDGRIDRERLLMFSPAFVAFGHAHAELGTLQPVAELCAAARAADALVHVDASLTAGRIRVDLASLGRPDLVTLSFHHFGGPMGVGALVVREELELAPLLEGGVEENGRRPGTPNLAGVVGAGVAARLARRDLEVRERALKSAASALAHDLSSVPGVIPIGPDPEQRLPGHLSLLVRGVDSDALVVELSERGVLAATGSPCASDAGHRSACLHAAGYAEEDARSVVVLCVPPIGVPDPAAIRFAAGAFVEAVQVLRAVCGALPAPPA